MLKRPTSKRKSKHKQIELNLVPILDTMVTLIGFLLFTTSFLAIVSIESPFPETSSAQVEKKVKERPLQLTLSLREKEIELWSPFDRIPSKIITHSAPSQPAGHPPGQPDIKKIHDALVAIKQQFPEETQLILVPYAAANYDLLIGVMDAARLMEPSDPPLFRKNPKTGNSETVKTLFPEIIFGNLLETEGGA
ncbi:biopolymer transporter ExbD [Bdellovibrionota bacterium FG-2]